MKYDHEWTLDGDRLDHPTGVSISIKLLEPQGAFRGMTTRWKCWQSAKKVRATLVATGRGLDSSVGTGCPSYPSGWMED